ncbi:MAG: F0F1 ATP synthase subunit epsilon [Candidatus Paracaedibacteraceae bacterium]|nr:F0F1 ATP synthase subunit epsilon [Candidatus Paracaedibacteraceae bacterium]
MQRFSFIIISVSNTIFHGDVEKVILPGVEGVMTLLPNHMSIISELTPGTVSFWSNDNEKNIPISGGFVEMRNNKCTVYLKDDDGLLAPSPGNA